MTNLMFICPKNPFVVMPSSSIFYWIGFSNVCPSQLTTFTPFPFPFDFLSPTFSPLLSSSPLVTISIHIKHVCLPCTSTKTSLQMSFIKLSLYFISLLNVKQWLFMVMSEVMLVEGLLPNDVRPGGTAVLLDHPHFVVWLNNKVLH